MFVTSPGVSTAWMFLSGGRQYASIDILVQIGFGVFSLEVASENFKVILPHMYKSSMYYYESLV